MGLDLAIVATRTVSFVRGDSTCDTEEQEEHWGGVINCTTEETLSVVNAKDPIAAYINLVIDCASKSVQMIPVYADNDPLGLEDPVGEEVDNWGNEHIKDFNEWKRYMMNRGFAIKFVAW